MEIKKNICSKNIIDENFTEIYNYIQKIVMVVLPIKKSWGYSQDKCISDELDFIIEELLESAIDYAIEDENGYGGCESGFYKVEVNIYGNSINIEVSFSILSEISLKI
jgi:hypothetical protein